jgi:hypothetical protein
MCSLDLTFQWLERRQIGRVLLRFFAILFAILMACLDLPLAFGDDTDFTLKFVARPLQVANPEHATTLTGHAFLIIGVKTNQGIKEEVFGFYPVSGSVKGMIKGPGMLKAEERCGPNDDCGPSHRAELLRRLSEVRQSVTVPLSSEERTAVYAEIKRWDSQSTIGPDGRQLVPGSDAEYRLFDHNCMDFIAAVASRLGYPTPNRSNLQTPAEFLAAFAPMVEQERRLRQTRREALANQQRAAEAEARAHSAQEAARAAEERAQAAERRAQEAEQARAAREATTIPAGWVACTCPHLHSASGKWVNGILYHPQSITCPH